MNEYFYLRSSESCFPFKECKELFNQYKNLINSETNFNFMDFIQSTVNLYAVYVNSVLGGFMWVDDNTKNHCYIGGMSFRKNGLYTKEAIQYFCKYLFDNSFFVEIMAETNNRHTAISLLKAKFKKKNENLYILTRGNLNV